ncbi:hypothetical protein RB653_002733 [Dictyostelium firmibasis]|uniref:Uncharacterized protein n=1 Tax=Dictyostelium firmibasis TaxID=79012 RepID=A0AAN7U3F1_9MYCE
MKKEEVFYKVSLVFQQATAKLIRTVLVAN